MSDELTTRDSLGIFWRGEETDGFNIYGYWPDDQTDPPRLSYAAWLGVEVDVSRLSGDGWTVFLWSVKVTEWPPAKRWQGMIDELLGQLIAAGAQIAWLAVEGDFADPPCLFDPQVSGPGVWAARTNGGDTFAPPGIDEPFRYLAPTALSKLRAVAGFGPCQHQA